MFVTPGLTLACIPLNGDITEGLGGGGVQGASAGIFFIIKCFKKHFYAIHTGIHRSNLNVQGNRRRALYTDIRTTNNLTNLKCQNNTSVSSTTLKENSCVSLSPTWTYIKHNNPWTQQLTNKLNNTRMYNHF